jgi:hypothetical protein
LVSNVSGRIEDSKMTNLLSLVLTFDEIQKLLHGSCGAINPDNVFQKDSSGYGLEVYPEKRLELGRKPRVTDVIKFYVDNKEIFDKYPALRVGWDRTELNIGVVTGNKDKAINVAFNLDQRAIFDISAGVEVYIGHKGVRTYFPGYPLEQRLQELLI